MNKTLIAVLIAVVALVGLSAGTIMMTGNGNSDETPVDPGPSGPDNSPAVEAGDILVVYFSKTGTTQSYAERIAGMTGADLVSIEPVNPYPSSYSETTDIAREELDSNARPAISTVVDSMDQYDTIIVGYPIWYGAPPMVVLTFLESYDLTGKTVINFCTSGSSSIFGSTPYIEGSAAGADVIQGLRMSSSTDIAGWLSDLGITTV